MDLDEEAEGPRGHAVKKYLLIGILIGGGEAVHGASQGRGLLAHSFFFYDEIFQTYSKIERII